MKRGVEGTGERKKGRKWELIAEIERSRESEISLALFCLFANKKYNIL